MHPAAASAPVDRQFAPLLADVPLFLSNGADSFKEFFADHVGAGGRLPIMEHVLSGKYAPSRNLLEQTAAMVRRAQKDKRDKAVVVVKGGPGTGKSVIALNLLGMLSKMGVNAQHATGSKAFTENLWQVLGPRSKAQVRYFNDFGQAEPSSIDVVLADEAHRIRGTSNHRFTKSKHKSDRAQVDEILEAMKVAVFFIDDH